jgi:CubicO group peptidase (beta-lactamase class C family)
MRFLIFLSLVLINTSARADFAAAEQACRVRADAGLFKGVQIGMISSAGVQTGSCGEISSSAAFELGSISKAFAGIILAKMSLDGKASLSAPIATYVPELKGSFSGTVTTAELATHMARLPRDFPGSYGQFSESQLVDFLKSYQPDPVKFPVGGRNYSNLGFATLGLVISRIYEKPFAEVVQQEILTPLRMGDTGFATQPQSPVNLTQGYDVLLEPAQYHSLSDLSVAWGGVISDLSDMMIFLNANLDPDNSPLGLAITLSQAQGLGWDSLPGEKPVWKSGGMTDGFSTIMELDSSKNLGVIILGNEFSSPSIDPLGDIAMGKKDSSTFPTLPDAFLNQVIGIYQTADHTQSMQVISVHGNYLGILVPNSIPVRLLSLAGSSTRFSADNGSVSYDRVEFSAAPTGTGFIGFDYLAVVGWDANNQPIFQTTHFVKQ